MMAERSITADVSSKGLGLQQDGRAVRVLYVFPGEATGSVMIFAKKQVIAMKECNVFADIFSLESRTSLGMIHREKRRFRHRLASFRPDLVHAQYGTMTAFFACLATMVPLVITYRGSDLNPAPSDLWIRSVVRRGLSQVAALKASRIICVSERLRDRLWWARGRAVVIPSGVDTGMFFPRPRSEARDELGWKPEERIVLFNAGASPAVKRLDLAQAGVSEAEKLCCPIRLIILDGTVPQMTVATMLNGADCLLVTSDWEGSPTIVQEALACDLPVVSVDVGDVRERLLGVTPSRIVRRDPLAIARGLAEVLECRAHSNGHQVIDLVSQRNIVRRTVALYHDVLGIG